MAGSRGYDYIIIGAGSAGCVLANRLSADPSARVLLIEAGGPDRNPLIRVPLMAGFWFTNRYFNWCFETEPQEHLAGRRISWPRGKVWGGSSSINGLIYVRGHPLDYEIWRSHGLPDWGWDGVLPFYRKAEHFQSGGDKLHGGDGPLPVCRGLGDHPLSQAFLQAGQQAGHPYCDDFNGADPVGVGIYDYNIRNGQRWSAARAYLAPALARQNLDVMSHAEVSRLLLSAGRVTGIEVQRNGRLEQIQADGEVLLSSGAIGSPAILMRSGIGRADALSKVGVAPQIDLPEVGQNLQDHLQTVVSHASSISDGIYELRRLDRLGPAMLSAIAAGKGHATELPIRVGGFLKTDVAMAMPDVQIHYILGSGQRTLRVPGLHRQPAADRYGVNGSVCQLRPESRGEIFLKSADPQAPPGIQPNYLSSEADRRSMRDAVGMMRDVFSQAGFAHCLGEERRPGAFVQSEQDLDDWIARTAVAVYHPVGTCRMGSDPSSVVDSALKVRGVDGLRVVDASVAPTLIGGNTHGMTVMIAEKAAHMITGG
jgi:choline dehydrogenase